MTDLAEFDVLVELFMSRYPSQRLGQASSNVLFAHRQPWAREIWNTELDPFYRDDRLPAFRVWLAHQFEADAHARWLDDGGTVGT